MCYNCGCEMPADDMGQGHAGVDPNGKSITTKTFQAAASSQGQSEEKAMQHTLELLQKELSKKDNSNSPAESDQ